MADFEATAQIAVSLLARLGSGRGTNDGTPVAFTWKRYRAALPRSEQVWRRTEEKIMAAEAAAQHPYAGMSVLDIAWQELDDVMDLLMEQGAPDKDTLATELYQSTALSQARTLADEWYTTLKEWGELRGQAQGIAFAIAVLTNPYAADVPAVKKEAMARWQKRQDAGE
jgi:hypothetical protein